MIYESFLKYKKYDYDDDNRNQSYNNNLNQSNLKEQQSHRSKNSLNIDLYADDKDFNNTINKNEQNDKSSRLDVSPNTQTKSLNQIDYNEKSNQPIHKDENLTDEEAALRIQSFYRGFKTREDLRKKSVN
ncbi:unnamed protein product [Brachionus calyciflorus]|uniref:Uncharacterized protein n=1 Tax=Brachionus calyciflorus TaxID=104777 RepID=A0A813W6C1_9BILA|nr:unnamed protein product [Brachionus calyciflorus]